MNLFDFLNALSRRTKRTVLLALDTLLVPIALYISFALRFGTATPTGQIAASWQIFLIVTLIAIPLFSYFELNRAKLSAYEMADIGRSAMTVCVLMGIASSTSYFTDLPGPRSIPLIFGSMFLILHIASRMLGKAWVQTLVVHNSGRIPVAIYGAGSAGVQLLSALRLDPDMRPVTFIDDNVTLQQMTVSGLRVRSRNALVELVNKGQVQRVLLATPSASNEVRQMLIRELTQLGCDVHALPSYSEMMEGDGLADSLRPVTPDMLLGRDKVDLEIPEVARAYAGRSILVTGAGGSIGSELCRQILRCNPQRLVLFDHSEYALYLIERELQPLADDFGISIEACIGSVCDRPLLDRVLTEHRVDIVLHAAAYKHVPLVEKNEIEGARNNIIGTRVTANAAAAANVERFILVSTDKAVRPTNVMGASKRLAELVVQDIQTRCETTKFSMVRFGNVLGSSGSVIPLFQDQIARGGPVTLTHDKITRYFMTIPEAARLVLLAGAYAEGGDVFVLDMGTPVSIRDLARRVIELSGRSVKDADNPHGDIAIETVGLRPGEKLYEELLIGDNTLPTPHEKILRAQEGHLSEIEMVKTLRDLEAAIAAGDVAALRAIIEKRVDGYHQKIEAVI